MSGMDLFQLREGFSKEGIMICFNGPFSHSIIEEIGNAVRNYLASESVAKAAVLDVFAIYIEQTQNVRNYIVRKHIQPGDFNSSIITIAKKGEHYVITSGNLIEKGDTDELIGRLKVINDLSKDDLKKRYREQIRKKSIPPSAGAGLGLMEIARRASEKLTYAVKEIDEAYNFFSLTVVV
jgi:hypothetical protein